ncbi:hypothetical protein ACOXXX_17005 [Thalassococcus sp. BH17M4-6]
MKLLTLIQAAVLVILTVFGAFAASTETKPCPMQNAAEVCEL